MSGILIAYFLKEKGLDVIVIEANTIASGQTKNTTAKITSQHNLIYSRLIAEQGEKKAVQGLTTQIFKMPKEKLEDLPNGHGGIVEHDGQKVGVYKNQDGECFIVSTKCTHLGCQLEWNPDELTWDCPCHGSRFNYKGRVINNPALKDLQTY